MTLERTGRGNDGESEEERAFSDFVTLLTRHQADLWAFILSQLPGHPDVADILQETNVTLWTNQHRFEQGTDFIAWSITVAKFAILKHLKKGKRSDRLVFREELLELVSAEAPEVFRDGNRRIKWLEVCLGKLRPADRDLIRHRYQGEGNLEEYGRRIGRSASALSVTLHRVRAALRTCIEKGLNHEEHPA
jgi:RNA polymerase sigma-70 factor, ECF subfamily